MGPIDAVEKKKVDAVMRRKGVRVSTTVVRAIRSSKDARFP